MSPFRNVLALVALLGMLVALGAAAVADSGESNPGAGEAELTEIRSIAANNAEASESGSPPGSAGVPIRECPEAAAAMEAAGIPLSTEDHLYPDCDAGLELARVY